MATESGTIEIEYTPGSLTVDYITAKIAQLGYEAKIKEDAKEKASHKEEEIKDKKRKLLISILLSLPLLYTMVGHMPIDLGLPMPRLLMNPWFQLLLATPVQFISVGSFM